MPITYTDQEIEKLKCERKLLPRSWSGALRLQSKRGHCERNLDFVGEGESRFRLILRKSRFNILDFSIILAVRSPGSNRLFRLQRYNGRSHEHTNAIEHETFYDFHIHTATQRYQERGAREDAYARVTDRYDSFHGAMHCLINDMNLQFPPDLQGKLFTE